MKTTRFYAVLAIAAAAVACNKTEDFKEPAPLKSNEFNAVIAESITKVSMGADYSLTWDAQDKVSVFGTDGVNAQFSALSSGATTVLEGPADYVIDAQNTYYAVYPYSAENSINEGVVTTTLPSEYAPKAGTFPENYSVAKCTDGKTLSFYNVCGLMGFNITRSDIKTVTFSVTGENEYLAGKIKVNVDNVPEPTYEVVEGSKEITLAAETVFASGNYYVPMLPQEFSAMTVTMYNTDGQVSEMHNLSAFTLNRSHHIAPLPVDEGEFEDAEPLKGFPAVWTYGSDNFNNANWVTNNAVPADQGRGVFSYVAVDNINDNYVQDISGGDPRVKGAWPGDYWLYEVPSVIPANTRFSISFAARVSDTGHKFWMLEYLDGEEWKPAAEVKTTIETGESVDYTHAMENANQMISGIFTVTKAMSSLKVRYRCVANWRADGGVLTARNGGTVRMSSDENIHIMVVDLNGSEPQPMYTEWLFSEAAVVDGSCPYVSTFGGLEDDAVNNNAIGDGGCYVASNVAGNGIITYVQVDKESYNSTNPKRYVGSTGHPIAKGVMAGDYWLFQATDGRVYEAGTKLNITFWTRISSTGQKYWMLECWNGSTWIPAPGYETQTATIGEETVSYNLTPSTDANNNSVIDVTWTLAQSCKKMEFRYKCVANYNKNGVVTTPGAGTCRIAGAAGTSPIFRIVE